MTRRAIPRIFTVLTLTVMAWPVGAAEAADDTGWTAFDAVQARDRARHLHLAEAHAHPGTPLASSDVVAQSNAFQDVQDVKAIARDTLKTRESFFQNDTQAEPDIAVDPNAPNVITAVFQQGRNQFGGCADPGFATSHDGGRSWKSGNLPHLGKVVGGIYTRPSDPVVVFGPDGTAYAQTLAVTFAERRTAIVVQRSSDGGLTWSDPFVIREDVSDKIFNDKNWITADIYPGSPHFGRLYAAWDRVDVRTGAFFSPTVLSWSDDRGRTWSSMQPVTSRDANTIGVNPLVQPNGDLTLVYETFGNGFDNMVSRTSHDGGQTFGPVEVINSWRGSEPPDMRTGALLSATVDAVTGAMYVAWQDVRYHGDGLNDIVMSRSVDGGKSWSPLKVVNHGGPSQRVDRFTPDVAAYGGNVHVVFNARSFAGQVYSNLVEEHLVSSTDGGITFGPELSLGPPANLRYAAEVFGDGTRFLGDYQGLAATAAGVHPAWEVSGPPPGSFPHHQRTWSATVVP